MNLSRFTQEVQLKAEGAFVFKSESYGYTQEFTANDLQNNANFHRSIKFTCQGESGLWKIEQGCFNGYGKTLDEALQIQNKDCTTKAFLAPTYD